MSRLTLRLPETLHQQLVDLAQAEGVSLNQYIVYALTRTVASNWTIQLVDSDSKEKQIIEFRDLLQQLGQADATEMEETLASREQVEPEPELTSDVVKRLKARIKEQAS